jgi:UTP--glucose-1-phosphate uridylyltransferase
VLAAEGVPVVDLDPDHFKLVGDFEPRVAGGVPSLRRCRRLTVRGDVWFGPGVEVRGEAEVDAPEGPLQLEHTVLEG